MKFSPGSLIRGILEKISKDNDIKTTVIGAILIAVLAADNIDFNAILSGDTQGLINLSVVVLLAIFAYFTNKPNKEEK